MINNKETLKDILETTSSLFGLNDFYSHDMIYWEDKNKNILSVSSACEKITGYTSEDFINNPKLIEDIILTKDFNSWENRCINVHVDDVNKIQFRIKHKSGNIVWLEHDSQKLYNAKGAFIGLRSSNRDITKRKYTNEIIESSSSVLFLWKNEEGYPVEFVSANVESILGYSIEDFISGKISYGDIIHPKFRDRVKLEINYNIETKGQDFRHESYQIITKDNRTIWVSDKTVVKTDSQNNIIYFHGIITDITEQIEAEQALKIRDAQYKSLVENSPNGIVIHSNGKIVYANGMAMSLLKVKSLEKYLGVAVSRFIHPDVKEEVLTRLRNVSEGMRNKPFFESKFLRADNTPIDVAIASSIINYGGSKAVQTVFYDITASKLAQDRLRKSEEVYRNVFNYSPLGILHFDKEGIITDCNEEFASIIGTVRKRLIGFNMLQQLKDLELKGAVQKSLTIGSGYYQDNYTSVITGKTSPAIGRFNAIYSDKNEIIGGVGLIEDITERVKRNKLQKALFDISETASKTVPMKELYKELHLIIKELMSAKNIYVAMHNSETNIITFPYFIDEKDVNPERRVFGSGFTEHVFKKKKSQIITTEIEEELAKNKDVSFVGSQAAIWVGIYLNFEGHYKGVLVLQDYNNSDTYNEDDVKILEFVSEQIVKVLDKKYANRRLRESVKELSEAKRELEIINQNKDRFFSIIAHDLRAPFNTLLGVSEMISGNMDEMSIQEVREISGVIHSSTQNLFKLIENLLNWSRLQMGTFQTNPEVLSIEETLLETLEIVKYTAQEKNIKITNNVSEFFVFADEECVKTVLRNLLNNAIKFTYRNGSIVLNSIKLKTHIQISIEDNGVGMDQEVVDKLFSITSKSSTVGTENEKGTGLGLILCKDLIEKNNGTIWAESEFGKGSKFSFTLPKKQRNVLLFVKAN